MKVLTAIGGLLLLASRVVGEVDPIVIKGSKFFYQSNDNQFFIKGIAYQQDVSSNGTIDGSKTYKDPLADPSSCRRDVPLLKELQTNTIRVYAIDPKQDHKECMKLLSDAGIYVIADLSNPTESIDRNDPAWTNALFTRYTDVVDAMAPYQNVLGFFAGNEVSNSKNTTSASAYVKAAVRDMKRYIKAKNYRQIGVGYATNDDSDIRVNMASYFNCHSKDESIDFWGYNVYSWCGNSTYQKSGYKKRTEEFRKYPVPIFFAEYGCNAVQPREFSEVRALFGGTMSQVWSGGIVYMYFQEENDYGLVSVDGNSVKRLPDFTNYARQIASVHPTGVSKRAYNPSTSDLQPCPAVDNSWLATANPLPPTPNFQLCSCMESSLECTLKDRVSLKRYGALFGTVCGYGVCSGISRNATTGEYGAFSVCNATQQLSYAFNQYYLQQKKKSNAATACDFDGTASIRKPKQASGQCLKLMKQAGADGNGTVDSSSGMSTSAGDAASGAATKYGVDIRPLGVSGVIALAAMIGRAMM